MSKLSKFGLNNNENDIEQGFLTIKNSNVNHKKSIKIMNIARLLEGHILQTDLNYVNQTQQSDHYLKIILDKTVTFNNGKKKRNTALF